MRLQEFVNPFCEAAENAFFQPNPSISEIAVNLRLKHKPNVSFKLLGCAFAYLRELTPLLASASGMPVPSSSCVLLFQREWQ